MYNVDVSQHSRLPKASGLVLLNLLEPDGTAFQTLLDEVLMPLFVASDLWRWASAHLVGRCEIQVAINLRGR